MRFFLDWANIRVFLGCVGILLLGDFGVIPSYASALLVLDWMVLNVVWEFA